MRHKKHGKGGSKHGGGRRNTIRTYPMPPTNPISAEMEEFIKHKTQLDACPDPHTRRVTAKLIGAQSNAITKQWLEYIEYQEGNGVAFGKAG